MVLELYRFTTKQSEMVEKILRKIVKKCIILMKINKKSSKIVHFSCVISFLLRIDAANGIWVAFSYNKGLCNIVLIKD